MGECFSFGDYVSACLKFFSPLGGGLSKCTRALEHSEGTWALGHLKGNLAFGQLRHYGTQELRALRHLGTSGISSLGGTLFSRLVYEKDRIRYDFKKVEAHPL